MCANGPRRRPVTRKPLTSMSANMTSGRAMFSLSCAKATSSLPSLPMSKHGLNCNRLAETSSACSMPKLKMKSLPFATTKAKSSRYTSNLAEVRRAPGSSESKTNLNQYWRQPHPLRFERGEYFLKVMIAHDARQNFCQHGTIIADNFQSFRAEQRFSIHTQARRAQIGFGAMNLSAVDLRANGHHREAAPVIRAERAVFVNSAAEFRHHDHRDAVALAIQIGVESGKPARQQVNLFSL